MLCFFSFQRLFFPGFICVIKTFSGFTEDLSCDPGPADDEVGVRPQVKGRKHWWLAFFFHFYGSVWSEHTVKQHIPPVRKFGGDPEEQRGGCKKKNHFNN